MTFAPEFSVKFTLTGPDGTIATFNDPTDANFVGQLTNITGLDGPEVRESGEVIVAFDGGVQGQNYYGRRPVTLEGICYGHTSAIARNDKISRLMTASNAMRGDAILSWTPSGHAAPVTMTLRRQQPLRVEGNWNKTFSVPMVAADPRAYSTVAQSLSTSIPASGLTPVNGGNTETFPVYTLLGPATNPAINNVGAGRNIVTTATLAFTDALRIDTLARTVTRGVRSPGSRRNFIQAPNLENGTLGFIPLGGVTAAVVSQPAISSGFGTKVYRWTASSTSAMIMHTSAPFIFNDLVAGEKVTVAWSAYVGTGTATHTLQTTFSWATASTTLTPETITFGTPIGTSGWSRFVAVGTVPATGTRLNDVLFIVRGPSSGANVTSDVVYADAFTLERAATDGAFFDGSNPLPGHLSQWEGTADASVSQSYILSVDPTVALTPWYSVIDFDDTRWSGLIPGANNVQLDYTTSGLGVTMRVDWRDAWL